MNPHLCVIRPKNSPKSRVFLSKSLQNTQHAIHVRCFVYLSLLQSLERGSFHTSNTLSLHKPLLVLKNSCTSLSIEYTRFIMDCSTYFCVCRVSTRLTLVLGRQGACFTYFKDPKFVFRYTCIDACIFKAFGRKEGRLCRKYDRTPMHGDECGSSDV